MELILTDTHLTDTNIEENLNIYNQAIAIAKEHELGRVLHGGDVFNSRASQKLSTLKGFKRILKLFKKNDMELYVIPGNHDKTDQTKTDSYLDIFDDHQNLVVFKGTEKPLQIGSDSWLHFFPFFQEDVYRELLLKREIQPGKNMMLTHYGISGALDNDGNKTDSKIETGLFSKYHKVLIGHYHNRQKIGSKIEYIGSTHQANFGEDDQKGFTLLKDDGSTQFIQSNFKKFIKVSFKEIDKVEIEKKIEEYSNSGENVRFEFECSEEELLKIDLEKIKKKGIDSKTKIITKVQSEEDINETTIKFTSSDLVKNLISYCQEEKIAADKRTYGLKLLKEV